MRGSAIAEVSVSTPSAARRSRFTNAMATSSWRHRPIFRPGTADTSWRSDWSKPRPSKSLEVGQLRLTLARGRVAVHFPLDDDAFHSGSPDMVDRGSRLGSRDHSPPGILALLRTTGGKPLGRPHPRGGEPAIDRAVASSGRRN